jgi:hypothetical protein
MRGLSSFVALVLLCAASLPAAAASATPGSVEPADPSAPKPAPVTSVDGNTRAAADEAASEKKAATTKARKRRYARYRYRHHGFFIPAPQYWFRPWPRYRYSRGYRRAYAGFPFFFRGRW